MAYARSSKVRFRVVSENMDELTKANDALDKLVDKAKVADDYLSKLGKGLSTKNLTKFNDSLDKLADTSSSSIKKVNDNFSSASERVKVLATDTRDSTSAMRKDFSDSARSIKDSFKEIPTSKSFKIKTNFAKTKDEMKLVGDSSDTMGTRVHKNMSKAELSSDKARTSFNKLSSAGSKISNMAATVSLAMIPVAAAFKKAADEATKLQNTYTTIKNLMNTSGSSASASAATAKKIQKENRKLSNEYGESQTSLASGSETLLRRGYSGSQDLAAHKKFLQASRASGDDYNSVVNYGASTLEQFGLKKAAGDSVKKMRSYTNKVLNKMAYGADLTATDFSGMGNALRYTGATSHSNNQSLASTIASIGVLSNNGQDGSVAGTGLRKVINSLISPTSGVSGQGVKALKSIGLSPSDLKDSKGNLYSLDKEFEILNNHMKGDSNGQKSTIFHKLFGATGQESALILSNNVKQMESLTGQVQKATNYKGKGYIEALSAKNMKSWANQVSVFKTHLDNLGQSFATYLLPGITKVLSKLNGFLKTVNNLPSPLKKAIAYTTGLAAAVGSLYVSYKTFKMTAGMLSGVKSMSGMSSSSSKGSLLSSLVSSSGSASTAESDAASVGSRAAAKTGTSLMSKVAYAGIGLDIGQNVVSAINEGVNSKKGGRDLWQGAGTAVGGGLAAVLSGGNPLVTTIGATIGNKIGTYFANSKAVKDINAGEKKSVKKYNSSKSKTASYNHLRTDPYGGTTTLNDSADATQYENKSGSMKKTRVNASAIATSGNKEHSEAVKYSVYGLNASDKAYINKAAKLETKANSDWADSASKAYSSLKKTYNSLYQLAKDKADKELRTDKKNYNYLVKEGVLNNTSAKSAYNTDKTTYDKRLKSLKSNMSSLLKSETKGGASRVKDISKVNREILSLTDAGGRKQAALTKSLTTRTQKLTSASLGKMITKSNSAYKKTVSSAKKTYDSEVSTANSRYKKEVKLAKDTKGLTESQRKSIIEKATDQRKETIANAKIQKEDTVSWAHKQRVAVIKEAKKQAGGAAAAFEVVIGKVSSSIPTLLDSNTKAGLYRPSKNISNTQAIKNSTNPDKTLSDTYASMTKTKKKTNSLTNSVFSHALGGSIHTTGTALVGEGGVELAYKKGGKTVRLLGSNGPAFEKVYSGERILTARDTKKVLAGGLGKNRVLPGYVNGTTGLAYAGGTARIGTTKAAASVNKLVKSSKTDWKTINKDTSKQTKSIKKRTVSDYDNLQKGSYKQLKQFDKGNATRWKNIVKDTSSYTDKTKTNSISDYNDMQKGVQKQMNQLNTGVTNSAKDTASNFGTALGKMKKYSHTAMSTTIDQLNTGISSIDKVLSQFGGNSSVIKTVHYAKGSNGQVGSNQIGVVNDAKSGPRQEAIIRDNNILLPRGRNAMVPIAKGDQILNGSQTQDLAESMGYNHFAKGSGVSKSALRKIISTNSKHPDAAFNSEYASKIKAGKTSLSSGVSGLSSRASKHYGYPWSSEAWSQMASAESGGGSGAGGTWRHNPGLKETDPFGASRALMYGKGAKHDGVDFSGSLGSSILAVHGGKVINTGGTGISDLGKVIIVKSDDGYEEIYQEFGGMNNIKTSVGDTIKTGQKIATLGALSGAGSGPHVHIGVTKGNPLTKNMLSAAGWYDVTKMSGKSTGSKKSSKKSSALSKLVAKQLAPQLKWISKNLQEEAFSGDGISGSIVNRAKQLEKIIKNLYPNATNNGIAAILGNWEFESSLNPAIPNSIGASGLGQWLNGRFTSLKNYARKHGKSWKNAGTQISFALNGDGSDSAIFKRILRSNASVSSLANEFSSEWERGGYNAQHVAGAKKIEAILNDNGGWSKKGKLNIFGEKNSEVAINPAKNSADGLINSAVSARSKYKNSIFNPENVAKQLTKIAATNPLTNNVFKKSAKASSTGNITVNANFNFTINADSATAGTATSQAIKQAEPQIKSIVQQMMAQAISQQEEATI